MNIGYVSVSNEITSINRYYSRVVHSSSYSVDRENILIVGGMRNVTATASGGEGDQF